MKQIIDKYNQRCSIPNDIYEHLPTLKRYSEECDVIVEMGVRSIVSTWALLAGNPKSLISIDLEHPSKFINHDPAGCNLEEVEMAAALNDIDFEFVLGDTTKMQIPQCDLLFIDTLHNYNQLTAELSLHNSRVKKYIILHDTETFKNIGELNQDQGLEPAIQEFLASNENWIIHERFINNNGLTVLKNITDERN